MDIAVLTLDNVADFGLCAIHEVLGTADTLREEIAEPPPSWTLTNVGIGTSVRTGLGHTAPTTPFRNLTRLPDILIVPAVNVRQAGGLIELITSPRNRPALELVREVRAEDREIAGACTGTFFLAEAGVLDGATATTSWWLAPVFRRRYPQVDLQDGLTVCRSQRLTTAGAAVAHIDLALALLRAMSPALADLVDRHLLIGWRANQSAFAIPTTIASHDPLTAEFERWVRKNIDQPIQISAAARALAVSERTLQRATATTLGMSPMDFINEARIEQAAHLLATTDLSAAAVAAKVGYLNVSTLRTLVHRRRGMTLRELRRSAGGSS